MENSMTWRTQGTDPDYRFSLANERTFLAWIRTALAMLAGGLLLHQLSARPEARLVNITASGGLACIAAILGIGAYVRWRANEIAMRLGKGLPGSALLPLLAGTVALLGGATLVLLLLS